MFTLGIIIAIFFWRILTKMERKANTKYANYLYTILVAAIQDALSNNSRNGKRLHS